MFPTNWASKIVMVGCYTVIVTNIRFHFLQKFKRFFFRDCRNSRPFTAEFQDMLIDAGEIVEVIGGLNGMNVPRF